MVVRTWLPIFNSDMAHKEEDILDSQLIFFHTLFHKQIGMPAANFGDLLLDANHYSVAMTTRSKSLKS